MKLVESDAFARVPGDVVGWAMCKLGAEEWLVMVVQALYTNARSCLRVHGKLSEEFVVKVQHSSRSNTPSLIVHNGTRSIVVSTDHGVHRNYYMLMILC